MELAVNLRGLWWVWLVWGAFTMVVGLGAGIAIGRWWARGAQLRDFRRWREDAARQQATRREA